MTVLFPGMMMQMFLCSGLIKKDFIMHVKENWIQNDFFYRISGQMKIIVGDTLKCAETIQYF